MKCVCYSPSVSRHNLGRFEVFGCPHPRQYFSSLIIHHSNLEHKPLYPRPHGADTDGHAVGHGDVWLAGPFSSLEGEERSRAFLKAFDQVALPDEHANGNGSANEGGINHGEQNKCPTGSERTHGSHELYVSCAHAAKKVQPE